MRRKLKRIHAKESTQRWLVSYADYMTLMFALFVVLYAMAQVNSEQYPELELRWSEALAAMERQFSEQSEPHLAQSTGELSQQLANNSGASIISLNSALERSNKRESDWAELPNHLAESAKDFSFYDDIVIRQDPQWIYLELDSRLLFASGSAHLLAQAQGYIAQLAPYLANINNYIHVQGFADSPNPDSALYANNWQLSAQRALRVLQALQDHGVAPQRLAIEAYGPYQREAITAANRKVLVIAIARAQWQAPEVSEALAQDETEPMVERSEVLPDSEEMMEVPTADGGFRYTTRQE